VASMSLRVEMLAEYAAALETILLALPGRPVVNGNPMSPGDAIRDLRVRFELDTVTIQAIERGRTHVTAGMEVIGDA